MLKNKYNKKSKKSVVAFSSLAIVAVLLINATIMTANASNSKFSTMSETDNSNIKSLPTPTPKKVRGDSSSDKVQNSTSTSDGTQRNTENTQRQ